MTGREKCKDCVHLYSLDNTEPECKECPHKEIILYPENQDLFFIFLLIRNQILTAGMGEIIGINHLTLLELLNLYHIPEKKKAFEIINNVFNTINTERLVKQEEDRKREEMKSKSQANAKRIK